MFDHDIEQLAYGSVYQVLQDVDFERRALPPGTSGRMSAAIDRLRMFAAPFEQVRMAESLSLAIHKLEMALRGNNDVLADELREEIHKIGAEWMGVHLDLSDEDLDN